MKKVRAKRTWEFDDRKISDKRKEIVVQLGKEGWSRGEIGQIMRLTKPRVSQILKEAAVPPNVEKGPHVYAANDNYSLMKGNA